MHPSHPLCVTLLNPAASLGLRTGSKSEQRAFPVCFRRKMGRGGGVTPKQGSGQGEGVLSTWQWPLLRHPYADGITAKWSRPQPTSSPSRSARAHRRVWGASRNVGCRLPLRAGCGHWRLQSPRVLWMPSQVSKASSEQRFLHSVPLFWELLGQTPSPTVFITGALSSLYPLRVPTWRWAEHGKKSNVVPQCI